MRTGGMSPPSALVLFGIAIGACGAPSTPSGIRHIAPSVSSAACVVATNMSWIEGARPGVIRHTPAMNTHTVMTRRVTKSLLQRIKVIVLAGDDAVDHGLHRFPRVGRVVGRIVSRRIDAGDLGPPVFGQQLIGIAVPRRERADLRVVEALE